MINWRTVCLETVPAVVSMLAIAVITWVPWLPFGNMWTDTELTYLMGGIWMGIVWGRWMKDA